MVAKTKAKATDTAATKPVQEGLDVSLVQDEAASSEVAVKKTGTDIAEYQPHEVEIVRVETQYANVVFDCTTPSGLEEAKAARVDIRAVRYALDKTKKTAIVPYQQAVKDAQARVNEVKEFGDTLITRVLGVEDPIHQNIQAEEKRIADAKEEKERIERERIEAIQAKITRFRSVAAAYASRSAADIAAILDNVKVSVILVEDYAEFEAAATIARDEAIDQLQLLHGLAVDREAAAALVAKQTLELEQLREKQRLDDIEAERLRKQRTEEDADRLKKQQDALDEQQRKLNEQSEQTKKDLEELARLRAAAAAPAPIVAVAAPVVAPVQSVAVEEQPQHATSGSIRTTGPVHGGFEHAADDVTTTAPQVDDIVEVVAMSFEVDNDTARAWLRAIQF